ncbi:MAG: hypothetical protein ABIN24_09585 [Dyadobacter sp.]
MKHMVVMSAMPMAFFVAVIFGFPWVETHGCYVGHAYGIFSLLVVFYFPWVETHGYDIGHAFVIF